MKQFGGRGKAVHSQANPTWAMGHGPGHASPPRPTTTPTAPAFKDKPNPWPPLRRRSRAAATCSGRKTRLMSSGQKRKRDLIASASTSLPASSASAARPPPRRALASGRLRCHCALRRSSSRRAAALPEADEGGEVPVLLLICPPSLFPGTVLKRTNWDSFILGVQQDFSQICSTFFSLSKALFFKRKKIVWDQPLFSGSTGVG